MIAYLRANLVVWIGGNSEAPPMALAYDGFRDGTGASVGQVWNGTAFVAPQPGSEAANMAAICQQADDALTALQAGIDQTSAWRTTGPGAGTTTLTTAQLSAAQRQSADNQLTTMRALKGLIRLARGKLDSAT